MNIQKIKNKIRKISTTQNSNEDILSFTTEEIKQLMKEKKIPEKIAQEHLSFIYRKNKQYNEWQSYLKNNPDKPLKELIMSFYRLPRILSEEETRKSYEETLNFLQFFELMLKHPLAGLSEEEPEFFRNIKSDEFGISRLIADPINNIHKMLKNFPEAQLLREGEYFIQAKCKNSDGDEIALEYTFHANNQKEADEQAEKHIKKILGIQKKISEACWQMACKKLSRKVECTLAELMETAYHDRKDKNSFSSTQRYEFFLEFRSLNGTQFKITRNKNSKNFKNKTKSLGSIILPLVTIHETSPYDLANPRISKRYPNKISFSVLDNSSYVVEKMYHVGAPIKAATLELRPEDIALAEWIQIRKSQKRTRKNITFHNRKDTMELAGLQRIKHTGMANKRLLEKFKRLKQKDIIKNFPKSVKFPLIVQIR